MCLGVPMQVVAVTGLAQALCSDRHDRVLIDTMLVGPLAPGDWVMTFLGAAREVIDAETAARSLAALAALRAIMAGEAVDIAAAFPDLVDREPTLPDHLLASGSTR